MKIATAGSRLSKAWKTEDLTWEQFVDRLRSPTRTGETMREYQSMKPDEKAQRKDTNGGFVGGELRPGRRVKGSVINRWLVTLDADNCAAEDWPRDWDNFSFIQGLRCCVYSTHSHTPDKPRLRWIVPLSRAVSPDEYEPVARKVAEWIGIEKMDPLTYEAWRMMFWPSCCKDGKYIFAEADGDLLDPDAVLREYGPDEAWRNEALWPVSSKEGEIVRRGIKQQADPRTKPGVLGAFCRVYSVEDAIDAFGLPYERCEGMRDRYTYTHGTTAAGAVVYNDGLFLYSNHSTDPASRMCCNAFDLVRVHRFGELDEGSRTQDPTKLPSYKRMIEVAASDPQVQAEQFVSQFGDLGELAGEKDTGASGAPVSSEGRNTVKPEGNIVIPRRDDGKWLAEIGVKMDKKTGLPEPTMNNAYKILCDSPYFKGRLAFCEMGEQIYVLDDMPWESEIKKADSDDRESKLMGDDWEPTRIDESTYRGPSHIDGRPWVEEDRNQMYMWFERLGWSAKQKTNGMLDNVLVSAARKKTFSPIEAFLTGLKWDGVPRLDTMLIRWMGAEDNELNRTITRLWMMGAVDRALRPGCQFDNILVFKGKQGIGKTRMMRALVGDYYTNAVQAATISKENSELLQGMWVADLDEIDSVKRSSLTQFKSFITTPVDRYRKAYAVDVKPHPRQCVFFGTTNENSFLRDPTGERRWWIVPCAGQAGMDTPELRGTLPGFDEEVPQLWAEAVYRWRERIRQTRRGSEPLSKVDAKIYLNDDRLAKELDERTMGYKLADPDRDDIEEYLEELLPENWETMSEKQRQQYEDGEISVASERLTVQRKMVTLKELRQNVFGDSARRSSSQGRTSLACRITSIMDNMPGWRGLGRIWVPKEEGRSKETVWERTEDSSSG